MEKLSDLPNIGLVLEEQLNKVGIYTLEELKEIGSKEAWYRILMIDDSACIHRLYAIEGAIENIQKKFLSAEIKLDLKNHYNEMKENK